MNARELIRTTIKILERRKPTPENLLALKDARATLEHMSAVDLYSDMQRNRNWMNRIRRLRKIAPLPPIPEPKLGVGFFESLTQK